LPITKQNCIIRNMEISEKQPVNIIMFGDMTEGL
jgi:hypothetical protein